MNLVPKLLFIILTTFFLSTQAQKIQSKVFIKSLKDSTLNEIDLKSKNFKDFNSLTKYNDSIHKQYQIKGYISATHKTAQINDSTYHFVITLNQPSTYHIIDLNEIDPVVKKILGGTLSRKRNETIIQTQYTDSLLLIIHQHLLDNGNLLNKVQLTETHVYNKDTIKSKLKISIGKTRKIDRVVISGYDDFPDNIKKQLLNNKSTITKNTISRIENTINSLQFAEAYKTSQLLLKKDSTLLYIYLKKRNDNAAEGFLGLNNTDGVTQVTGNLNLRLSNNLNRGELLLLKYRSDDKKQRLLEINTELPYLFNTKTGINGTLNITRRDTLFQNSQINLGIFYQPTFNQKIAIGYLNRNSVGNQNQNAPINNISLNAITSSFHVSKLNNSRLNPVDLFLDIEISYGSRKIADNNSDNQFALGMKLAKLFKVTNENTIYLQASAKRLSSKNIQFNELYQLGGSDTVRGFLENSIDSSSFISLQSEFRRQIGSNFYAHSIIDIGFFEQYETEKSIKLYGIGGGLGILTKSGVLNVSLTNGSFNKLNFNISNIIAQIRYSVLF